MWKDHDTPQPTGRFEPNGVYLGCPACLQTPRAQSVPTQADRSPSRHVKSSRGRRITKRQRVSTRLYAVIAPEAAQSIAQVRSPRPKGAGCKIGIMLAVPRHRYLA